MVSMRVSKQQALIILACLLPLFGLGCVGGAVYKTLGVVEAPFDDNDKCTAPIDWKALNPLGNNGLTEEMESHKFVFVLGAHHSGTTLLGLILGLHDQTASLEKTHKPENEGQHVQSVYAAAKKRGGMFRYGYKEISYMTERDATVTVENRQQLFRDWARYWDLSQPVLVEKSPPHLIMSRYLQALFGTDRSYFPIILRHPLGAANFFLRKVTKEKSMNVRRPGRFTPEELEAKMAMKARVQNKKGKQLSSVQDDCGYGFLQHWIYVHRGLIRDLTCLRNARVLQFERFLGVDNALTQKYADAVLKLAGLSPTVQLNITGTPRKDTKLRPLDRSRANLPLDAQYEEARRFIANSRGGQEGKGSDNEEERDWSDNREETREEKSEREDDVVDLEDITRAPESAPDVEDLEYGEEEEETKEENRMEEGQSAKRRPGKSKKSIMREKVSVARRMRKMGMKDDNIPQAPGAGGAVKAGFDALRRPGRTLQSLHLDGVGSTDVDIETSLSSRHQQQQSLQEEQHPQQHPPPPPQQHRRLGRKLLEYHGSRKHLKVRVGGEFDWIPLWLDVVDHKSEACMRTFATWEPELNKFGYSLYDLKWVGEPEAFKDHLLRV